MTHAAPRRQRLHPSRRTQHSDMATQRLSTKCRIGPMLYKREWADHELANRTGLTRSRINTLKNARAQATTIEALLIARALNCRVADIFSLDPDPEWLTQRGM
jgi:DNA-binding Xre family transcriptional regulator